MATTVVAGAFASAAALAVPASAQASSGVADYVPDTALIYAEFELDHESDQFAKAADLLERANLTALLDDQQQADLQMGAGSLSVLADGQAGVFMTSLPIDEGLSLDEIASDASEMGSDPAGAATGDLPAGWAAVIDPTDVDTSFAMYSDLVLGDEAETAEEIDYNGYTILYVAPADEYSDGAAIAKVDDVIAVATTPDDIEPVIDTAAGDLDPLSESDDFTNVRGALETDVLASGYVNGPALLDAVNAVDPAIAEASPELAVSLAAYQGFVFWADDPGFRMDSVAIPSVGSVPAATAYNPTYAANVPDSSLFYVGGNDLGQNPSLDALALIMAQSIIGTDLEATPAIDAEANADEIFAEAERVIGFNIKTDLVDQLVGEWAIAGSASDLTSDSPFIQGVFVTSIDQSEPVANVLSTITNIIASQPSEGFELSSRQVDLSDVTVLTVNDAGFPMVIEFGVVGDKLLIGINRGLDAFLGDESAPLSESANFQATFDALPSDITSLSYLDVQNLLPIIEESLSATTTLDADPSCTDYATQEEAQTAYDDDFVANYMLDTDYDGEACEDFFAPATPETTPSGVSDVNLLSVGSVTVNDGETTGTHTIILIGE